MTTNLVTARPKRKRAIVPKPKRCCICKSPAPKDGHPLIQWVTAKPKPLRERPWIHGPCYQAWENGMLAAFAAMAKHMEAAGLLDDDSVL